MTKKLSEPGKIGKMIIRNRIVMPPMLMGYGTREGYVTEQMTDYFEARAKGGTGLVIVEATNVRDGGKVFPFVTNCYDDSHLPGLTKLATAIKKHGATAAVQLADGGRNTRIELTGEQPMGPSAVATHKRNQPKEMTHEDIAHMVGRFARAMQLLQKAGFEGVEMHGGHVYLFNQFLSRGMNFRTDEYGGSVENRCRFLQEVLQEGRKLVGDDFPIWVRINAIEPGIENGINIDEAKEIAIHLEKIGYQAISVTAGGENYEATMASSYYDEGYLVDYAAEIKKVINVPVIAVGRLNPILGEKYISEGKADFIAIGRGLMVDPEMPNKAMKERYTEITPCIACMTCVHRGVWRDKPITCAVNSALGRETELSFEPAEKAKRVVVVGAGPAGLEAARIAAQRGHTVTVFNNSAVLGGRFNLTTVAPKKAVFKSWLKFMDNQLKLYCAEIRAETRVTDEAIRSLNPDVVILAPGQYPKLDQAADGDARTRNVVTLEEVLSGKAEVGQNVTIVGSDGMACETATFLANQGKQVTVVCDKKKFAIEVLKLIRNEMLQMLAIKKADILTEARLGAITQSSVEFSDIQGQTHTIKTDTLILGNAYRFDLNLCRPLENPDAAMFLIGGCRGLQEHIDAVMDGYLVGRQI